MAHAGAEHDLPPEATLVALLSLPKLGPARLRRLLRGRTPEEAWDGILGERRDVLAAAESPAVASSWPAAAHDLDLVGLWERHLALGLGVLAETAPAYPAALREDPDPPALLLTAGDPTALGPVRVGIVGTRQCTRYGIDLAAELGHLCSDNGITVVSGLAAGIDAASHRGALVAAGAAPVAVAGTALDAPYPRANTDLWRDVAAAGVIYSETPVGAPTERWRFPARNRIIAGLSQVLVVIESHERGGSLYTAAQAMDRDRPVFAVPGPIRSPASAGCNRLLLDGCVPLCDPDDVLVAVGMIADTTTPVEAVTVAPEAQPVLHAIAWQPTTLDQLVLATGLSVGQVSVALEQLLADRLVVSRGRWYERSARLTQIVGPNGPASESRS